MEIEVISSNAQNRNEAISVNKPEVKASETEKVTTNEKLAKSPNENVSIIKQDDEEVLDKKLKDALTMANNKMKQSSTRCEFTYHETTNRVSIRLIDKETEEVVKEIPSEKTLKMIEKLWEIAGLLVDEKL